MFSQHGGAVRQVLAMLLVSVPFPMVAAADDVVLVNGRIFEGVIVTARDERQIRLRLPFGELALPSSLVAQVVESDSPLATFLERRRELTARGAAAEEWLELAQWAELRDLDYGYREVIQLVAKREPGLPGLAPHMRSLGFVLDEDGAAWVRPAPVTRAPAIQVASGPPPSEPSDPSRGGEVESERLTRAVELMAAAQLARETRELRESETSRQAQLLAVQPVVVSPYILWTGWTFPVVHSAEAPPPADPNPAFPVVRRPVDPMARALLRRQPGSLIPLGSLVR
jgi:hypothetical protein